MIRYLLVGYIIIYCVFTVFLFVAFAWIVPEEEKKTDRPWETPLDLILVGVGLAGMIFFLIDLQSNTIKGLWRPLSIALALTQLYLNLNGRRDFLRSGATEKVVGYTDITTILFLLPSICLNIYYAFR